MLHARLLRVPRRNGLRLKGNEIEDPHMQSQSLDDAMCAMHHFIDEKKQRENACGEGGISNDELTPTATAEKRPMTARAY
jgi:hypothetical protein